jgi:hypothetical protein
MILIRCDIPMTEPTVSPQSHATKSSATPRKSECGASLANATQVRVWRVSRYWSLPISRHAMSECGWLSKKRVQQGKGRKLTKSSAGVRGMQ